MSKIFPNFAVSHNVSYVRPTWQRPSSPTGGSQTPLLTKSSQYAHIILCKRLASTIVFYRTASDYVCRRLLHAHPVHLHIIIWITPYSYAPAYRGFCFYIELYRGWGLYLCPDVSRANPKRNLKPMPLDFQFRSEKHLAFSFNYWHNNFFFFFHFW